MRPDEIIIPKSHFGDLSSATGMPLHVRIERALTRAIREGKLPPGSRLENEVSICDRLGVSRPTVRRAIQKLVDDGMLVRRAGVGTQVVHGRITRGISLTSLHDDLTQNGSISTSQILECRLVAADNSVASHLGIEPGSEALYLLRVRFADGVPMAVMKNWLPANYTFVNPSSLSKSGLYQLFRDNGVELKVAKQKVGAKKASGVESDLLELEKGSALLEMERTAFDNGGVAVEYGRHCYRPDLYTIEMTVLDR